MKQFCIIRHAKSNWSFPDQEDIDRGLNDRGKHDAPKMATYLRQTYNLLPQKIYCSPAKRAQLTAKEFTKVFAFDQPIDTQTDIYYGNEFDVLEIIKSTENEIDQIMLFGHNPTLTYFVNLMEPGIIENLPTCSISYFKSNTNEWSNVNSENTLIEKILIPKEIIY